MGSDKHAIEQIREIFFRAQDIETDEALETFLAEACGNDDALRREVEELLAVYRQADTFLSRDASGEAMTDAPDLIGQTIGQYRILSKLGEGGFGEVFHAEQLEPLHRDVALKIIKLGMDTKKVVARFEVERQTLASMDHPNIAHAYDAGATESGRPYFVMELVRGVSLVEYCDRGRLSLNERMELFRQVCDAVQHAHQKGIIHRDLKPTNILVGEKNGRPLPKVIDFGVAKSLEGRLSEQALATLQEMVMGTPTYMSPEQLNQNAGIVDARTDIYSLGIILYELITGATPLENEIKTPASIAEMRQALEHTEFPKPSRILHTLGNKTTSIAQSRQIKMPALQKRLRGDLDWIVMKSIEKEPDRRYVDVGALGADLKHYLLGEPVMAGPPSFSYQARKYIRRHRMATVVAVSVAASLVIGACLTAIGMRQFMPKQKKAKQTSSLGFPAKVMQKKPLLPEVFIPGWKLKRYCSLGMVNTRSFGLRPDGSVLVVDEWGLCWIREGETCTAGNVISSSRAFGPPGAVLELPEGIYVSANNRLNNENYIDITGQVLFVPTMGGDPVVYYEKPIRNPFAVLAVPDAFDGPDVNPGDLLIFDNDHRGGIHKAIWAVDKSTAEAKRLIAGSVLGDGIRSGSFAPDGSLYVGLNGSKLSGAKILRISPEGDAVAVLDNFKISESDDRYLVCVAVHPVTGEVFFCARHSTYAFIPGKTSPRLVIGRGEALQWSPDGSRLYLLDGKIIWTLSGPDIAKQPVSRNP